MILTYSQMKEIPIESQGWCTGMTLRNGMGREVGGRIKIGSTWLIHVNVWQKPPPYYKVISLQLKFKKKVF